MGASELDASSAVPSRNGRAPLAGLEGTIALARLLTTFERITLDDKATLQYRNSTLMRELQALPVRLG